MMYQNLVKTYASIGKSDDVYTNRTRELEENIHMLIVQDNPKSPLSESYRTLRTNIQFSSFDDNMSTILVTSSTPAERKSTVSSNLALAMAETNKKVLLIDCDLRRPSIHKKFNLSNEKGFSNLLIGQYAFNEIAQKYIGDLYVLTSGTIPPNPSEMLSSKKWNFS